MEIVRTAIYWPTVAAEMCSQFAVFRFDRKLGKREGRVGGGVA